MMKNLTLEKLAYLQDLLNRREHVLRDAIRREVSLHEEDAHGVNDAPDSDASAFSDLTVDLGNAAVIRDLNELRAIEIARKRIENGVYGECAECGYEIPYARLQAQPIAERCAPCQERYEKTHADASKGASL